VPKEHKREATKRRDPIPRGMKRDAMKSAERKMLLAEDASSDGELADGNLVESKAPNGAADGKRDSGSPTPQDSGVIVRIRSVSVKTLGCSLAEVIFRNGEASVYLCS
jgi:hypothetical protein